VNDILLGVIAAAVVVMAAIQVAAVVVVARLARRIDRLADRFERDLAPVVASLQGLAADLSRATAVVSAVLGFFRGNKKESRPAAEPDDSLFVG